MNEIFHVGIWFTPVEYGYLESVGNSTKVSSVISCAYSCYHTPCCLSFSYKSDTEQCDMSDKLTMKGSPNDDKADIYKTGEDRRCSAQARRIFQLININTWKAWFTLSQIKSDKNVSLRWLHQLDLKSTKTNIWINWDIVNNFILNNISDSDTLPSWKNRIYVATLILQMSISTDIRIWHCCM